MIGQMLSYSWPVLIANISFIINENIDKIFLGRLLPEAISQQEVGIYGACCKLAIFLSIFIQAFRLGSEPFFFSHAKTANAKETYARIMHYFVLVVCLITLSLVANIELLKYFIKGNADQQALYWSGLKIVPVLLFAYVFLGVYMNLSIWYKLSDQTRYGLYISGVGAVLTIGLNIWLIPHYSYVASAWITLLAYLSMAVLSYILGQKKYPIPYRLKRNAAYILLAIVLVWLSFIVFNKNIFIGNGLLLAYILVVYWLEKKEVMAILKRV
jgi:O-antigen/teichoic acid export membrane protein